MERPDLVQRNKEAVAINAALHIGETIFSKTYNMNMTLIVWRGCKDIDIQFEDGCIVEHQYYHMFVRGNVKYPNFLKKQRMGMTKLMNCGMKATIIDYEDSNNITIKFEDGYIKKNVPFKDFNKGVTTNPNIIAGRVGLRKEQAQGFVATLIEYTDSQNVVVQFEDGTTKKTCFDTFKKGKVAHPSIAYNKDLKNEVLGKTYRTNCGLNATVIDYRTNRDLTIKFEDGEIKKTQLSRLEKGYTGHTYLSVSKECKYQGFTCKCVLVSKENTYYKVKHEDGFEGIMTPQEMIAYNNTCQ